MLDDGRNCDEIIHQMSAVAKAVNTAAFTLISASLEECIIEDRKDQRTKLEGSQQSEMIQQRQMDGPPINFDAKYSDLLSQ